MRTHFHCHHINHSPPAQSAGGRRGLFMLFRKTLMAAAALGALYPCFSNAAGLDGLFSQEQTARFDAFWYTRDREVQVDASNPQANAKPQRNIRTSSLGVGGTYLSGM